MLIDVAGTKKIGVGGDSGGLSARCRHHQNFLFNITGIRNTKAVVKQVKHKVDVNVCV